VQHSLKTCEMGLGSLKLIALKHSVKKKEENLLRTVRGPKIHMGRQGKHLLNHDNYTPGNSVMTHPDPQKLVDDFAGTGQPVNRIIPGTPGYKERVDFGEPIGYYRHYRGNALPTTKGIIHYSKDGVHRSPRSQKPSL
jgi:hypothetical protein